jgi:hypothetical protein
MMMMNGHRGPPRPLIFYFCLYYFSNKCGCWTHPRRGPHIYPDFEVPPLKFDPTTMYVYDDERLAIQYIHERLLDREFHALQDRNSYWLRCI